jgi:hypothetical protein
MTAMAAPASESSIKQLLAVTQAQKFLEGLRAQTDSALDNSIQQRLNGRIPTVQQQMAIETMKKRIATLMQEEMTWEKFEPMYLRLYKDSFSEEEIAGMLSFYETTAGQAVIKKMPLLMQNYMLEVQKSISGIAPKMRKIQENFKTEMDDASK